ncbi:hypothetical protein HanIR_Chr04g0186781 [Helianthus annuus]|nr:hypothetical protein HanIR_Chr04g0186781 [Helianthus annuus]
MCFLMLLYFTVGYSLMNILNPKAGGAIVVAYFPEDEPVNEPAGDDVDVPTDTAEQLETRKKKKVDTSEKKKKVEEPVTGAPRKQPSNLSLLDYVVVSDTLSGLDAGDKRTERDLDDDATLTEIVKRKKALEDKKKELDEQAAAALAEKKSRSQKETTAAASKSEVDLCVFSVKPRNLLEKIYKSASGSQEVEQVGEGGAGAGDGGNGGRGGRGGGVDVQVESSETTPHHTIYTKVVRALERVVFLELTIVQNMNMSIDG